MVAQVVDCTKAPGHLCTKTWPEFHPSWAELHLEEEGSPFLNLYKSVIWHRGGLSLPLPHGSLTLSSLLKTC